jgi:iron complex transport system substrate-binding protein
VRTDLTRRGFLLTAAVALVTAQGCSSDKPAMGSAGGGSVRIEHAFGQTTIPSPPTRVVSAGFTEQDSLLALGVAPIATTEWFGGQPFAVWPWATTVLGAGQPVVLSLANGIPVDQIAGLKPDLILAINAGCDSATYEALSAIAPTVPQSGRLPFFEPWKIQAETIGMACFQHAKMSGLIKGAEDRLAGVATAYPQFQDKTVLLLQGRLWGGGVSVAAPDAAGFLTAIGLRITDTERWIPLEEIASVLDQADALIWTTESDQDREALLAVPAIAALRNVTQNRSVFTGKDLAGAIAFSSVLSLPVVADRLPPLLATALG